MITHLLFLTLSPLLLAQGLYVRKVTPRLPEAAGARAGETGTGPALRLLILGDSAAAGVHELPRVYSLPTGCALP